MRYLYGPVASRRLGFSLGVSLTPYKTCTFDCVYCQLGKTTYLTCVRKEYVDIGKVLHEIKKWVAQNPSKAEHLDYITISGLGEPTLHSKIGMLIKKIKTITKIPVAVITNSSLLISRSVRKSLLGADLIVPSLDAVTQEIFNVIDKPHVSIKVESIIKGLIALRKEFSGKIWLEVMLVKGINAGAGQIKKLKEVVLRIKPDKVQLNSPVRSPNKTIRSLDKKELVKIKKFLGPGCEIV